MGAEITLQQLQAATINGFPFFAYTGIKLKRIDGDILYLSAPGNPGKVKMIQVIYDYSRDLYNVNIDGKLEVGLFNDTIADHIVDKMGVR